jgi:serine/threonine-protein kinase
LALAFAVGLIAFFTLRLANARNTALAEAARRRQIQDFMLTLFGTGDDQAAPSKELRVVTLLDRGVKQAAILNSDPETQAELYESLGRMYFILGRYPQADELLHLAMQKMRSAVGPEDVKNVQFMVELGALQSDQGQSKEADRLLREGLNLASRHLPPNDTTVLGAKSALGRALVQRGAYDQAIALLGPVIEVPPSGKEGADVLIEALGALAVANQYSGHYDVAEELTRRVLALDRKTYGDSHPKVATDLANLATALLTAGRASEGEQLYRQAAGILKGWYGADHPETLQIESFVALLQVRQNKLAEAEPLLREVLVAQEGNYGKNHPYVGFVLDTLGQLERKRGNLPEARAYLDRALKISAASFGEADAKTAMVKAHVGDVLEDGGHYADAERTYLEALRSLDALPLKGSVNVGVVEAGLGRALLRQRKYSEAEAHLLSGYAALMAKPSSYPDRLAQVRDDLGSEYLALHEPAKAAHYRAP